MNDVRRHIRTEPDINPSIRKMLLAENVFYRTLESGTDMPEHPQLGKGSESAIVVFDILEYPCPNFRGQTWALHSRHCFGSQSNERGTRNRRSMGVRICCLLLLPLSMTYIALFDRKFTTALKM